MAVSNESPCQWRGCTGPASKHVFYTETEEEVKSNSIGAIVQFQIEPSHGDLCELHISELRAKASKVSELELGQCLQCLKPH
jgi:hypothetical protein